MGRYPQYVCAGDEIRDLPIATNATCLQLARFDLTPDCFGIDAYRSGNLAWSDVRRASGLAKVDVGYPSSATEVCRPSLWNTLTHHGHLDHDVGLLRVTLNLQPILAMATREIGPEIAHMNAPCGDAAIDGFTHYKPAVGRDPRNVAPVHPQLILGRHSQVCLVRDNIGNAMSEIQEED